MTSKEIDARRERINRLIQNGEHINQKTAALKETVSAYLEKARLRLAKASDIVDYADFLMITGGDINEVLQKLRGLAEGTWCGWREIRLDTHALRNGQVYYHCIGSTDDSQCCVPRVVFTGNVDVMMAPICILFVAHKE